MDGPLVERLQRIYAAIGQTATGDVATIPTLIAEDADGIALWQDFTGGLSQAELSNLLHSLIHNIANLRDHARKGCKARGIDPSSVDEFLNRSILLLQDLSNNDKHGYPPRDGGWSGESPQILKVERILRMTTGGEAGSATILTFGSGGLHLTDDGHSRVIITADVLDGKGNRIGDAYDICVDAVDSWERGLGELGLV